MNRPKKTKRPRRRAAGRVDRLQTGPTSTTGPTPEHRRLAGQSEQVVTIAVPLREPEAGTHVSLTICERGHIETRLTRPQANTMRRVFDALHDRGAKMANGRYVQSSADVVRWLFEAIGNEVVNGAEDEE